MSDSYIKKNIKLSLAFDRYAMKNMGIYDSIPYGSWLIMADQSDPAFNRQSKSIIKNSWVKKQIKKQKVVIAEKQGRKWMVKEVPKREYTAV